MPTVEELRDLLFRGWIGAPGTTLRREDEKKAVEIHGFLAELARAFEHATDESPVTIVDAAAGKGYVGLLLAKLEEVRGGRDVRVVFVEREAKRVGQIRDAAAALGVDPAKLVMHATDVADASAWPESPHLVASLHACGNATDRTIERAVAAGARTIVIAPCCVASRLPQAERAARRARDAGVGDFPEVRRRYIEAEVLACRALALEAAGYRVETVPFTGPSVTPYNVALRARRGRDPIRMARAAATLERMTS